MRLHFRVLMIAAGILFPAMTRASTAVAVPEEELTGMADKVVWATVVDSSSYYDKQNGIATKVRLRVVEGYFGAAKDEIVTLDVPGGQLPGGLTTTVVGAPQFVPGEHVFAFLQKHGAMHHVLGLSYGLLKAHQDATGRWRVNRNLDQLTLVDRKGMPIAAASLSIQDELLDDLATRVRAHLLKAHGERKGGQR